MATASTVAAAGRPPASRRPTQASRYAGRAPAIHTTRYPDANPASRQPRSSLKVRVYKDANGVTDGNIIAAIISAQTATNEMTPSPMVPGIDPISRASTTTPTHATAATASNREASGVSSRRLGACEITRPHENQAGRPALPSRRNRSPNASIRDQVATGTVNGGIPGSIDPPSPRNPCKIILSCSPGNVRYPDCPDLRSSSGSG